MMLQASSRQSSGLHHHSQHHHQHQHQHQHQQHQQQHQQPQSRFQRLPPPPQPQHRYLQAPAAAGASVAPDKTSGAAAGDDPDLRSGRLASALLFMAVLVLMVDASRIILYSWYTDGSYLKYLYGSEAEIRWPKCSDSYQRLKSLAVDSQQTTTTPSPSTAGLPPGAVITAVSQQQQQQQRQQVKDEERQLDQFKDSLTNALLLAGRLVDSALGGGGGGGGGGSSRGSQQQQQPRRVSKQLVRVLFHASTIACLFFLAVAIFPAALRSHRGRCLLSCSLMFSLLTLTIAGASVTASLLNVYFFSTCELLPSHRLAYDFVPLCDALRRGFLAAECFSLVVICASVCILMRLKLLFCRALCNCQCCLSDGGVGGSDDGDSLCDNRQQQQHEFDLAPGRPNRRPGGGYPRYDEEEYLA